MTEPSAPSLRDDGLTDAAKLRLLADFLDLWDDREWRATVLNGPFSESREAQTDLRRMADEMEARAALAAEPAPEPPALSPEIVVEIVNGVARRLTEHSILGAALRELGVDKYEMWELAYELVTGSVREHMAQGGRGG